MYWTCRCCWFPINLIAILLKYNSCVIVRARAGVCVYRLMFELCWRKLCQVKVKLRLLGNNVFDCFIFFDHIDNVWSTNVLAHFPTKINSRGFFRFALKIIEKHLFEQVKQNTCMQHFRVPLVNFAILNATLL